jgi:DNA-binding IclR family transcriptional regulator
MMESEGMPFETPAGAAKAKESYLVDAVDRALAILMVVASEPDLGVSAIARKTGDSKARAFRLLRTLEHRGMVEQNTDTGCYRLGQTALLLGASANAQIDLVSLSRDILAAIAEEAGETALLRVRDKKESLLIAKWEPLRELRVSSVIGRRKPLYAGSSKVLLAFADEAEWPSVIPAQIPQFTDGTVTDPERLRQELYAIRRRGYTVSRSEVSEHQVSVSAPVVVAGNRVVASISLVAPAFRATDEHVDLIIRLVTEAASKLSLALGRT